MSDRIKCFGCGKRGPQVSGLATQEINNAGGLYSGTIEPPPDWVLIVKPECTVTFCSDRHAAEFFVAWVEANRRFSHPALGEELQIDGACAVIDEYAKKRVEGELGDPQGDQGAGL